MKKKPPPRSPKVPRPPPENAELLTVEEAAFLLRTSTHAVYNMVSRGSIPEVVKLGTRVLFRAKALRKRLGLG